VKTERERKAELSFRPGKLAGDVTAESPKLPTGVAPGQLAWPERKFYPRLVHYTTANLHPRHALTYTWAGWPTEGTSLPTAPGWEPLNQLWINDGLALKQADWTTAMAQLSF
jgi:hypothetical protein